MRRFLLFCTVLLLASCALTGPLPPAVPPPNIPTVQIPQAQPTKPATNSQETTAVATYPAILPSATPVGTPKPRAGRYSSPEHGITLSYPSDWTTEAGNRSGDLAWFFPEQRDVFTLLYILPHHQNESLEQAAQAAGQASTAGLSNIKLISSKASQLDDNRSAWVSEYTATQQESPISIVVTSAMRGPRLYTTLQYGSASAMAERRGQLNSIARSMKLTSPLRYGIPEDQALLDLGGESDNPRAYDPAHGGGGRLLYSGLVSFTPDLQLAPDLATSWDVAPNGTTYTFHLRPNARFHNGRPVTAEDVIYSWDRAADPATDSNSVLTYLGDIVGLPERRAGKATTISGLRAINAQTLQVQIDAPKPYFVMKLTYLTAFVVDRANVTNGPEWYRTPNGTGPYRLIRWEPGKVRIYERFKQFYAEQPNIRYVIEQIYAGTALSLYETGDLDITGIGGFSLDRARDPQGSWYGQLRESVSMCTGYIGIDSRQPPFDDPLVRQAFALAVDRERLSELSQGVALVANGLYPPALPGFRTDLQGQHFDPQAAKQLLARSRYAGKIPPITFTSSGYGSEISGNQAALADMWQRTLGITIRFENLEPSRWEEAMHAGRHGQLYSYGWCADYPDPENFADALFHTGAQQNLGNYSNAALDRLLEQARTERDLATRLGLYQQAEQILVDDTAAIFLNHSRSFTLIQPRIQGYVPAPIGLPIERYLSITPTT